LVVLESQALPTILKAWSYVAAGTTHLLSSKQQMTSERTQLPPVVTQQVNLRPVADTPWITANGIMVTGSTFYPLEVVVNDLGLRPWHLAELKNKKVWSIGEGFSDLLPMLLDHGADAKGLDIWYGVKDFPEDYPEGKLMKAYVTKYRYFLIAGDARHIPLRDRTLDMVLSHQLVRNFDSFDTEIELVEEMIRVTKVGGEVRIFGFEVDDFPQLFERISATHGFGVSFRFQDILSDWVLPYVSDPISQEGPLLIISVLS
jgi:SAM-dependent methyltransferase